MALYVHELLCVDGSGGVSVVHLTIEGDPGLASEEAGAIYTLDGEVLPLAPAVDVGQISA